MSMNDVPALQVGKASTSSALAALLGQKIVIGDEEYRLCKAAAAIATCAGKPVFTTITNGVPTWTVDAITTANDVRVAGIITAAQVGSDGSTGLLANDYFWLLVKGYDTGLVINASGVSIGAAMGTNTGGQLVPYTGADPAIPLVAVATASGAAQTGATAGSQLAIRVIIGL